MAGNEQVLIELKAVMSQLEATLRSANAKLTSLQTTGDKVSKELSGSLKRIGEFAVAYVGLKASQAFKDFAASTVQTSFKLQAIEIGLKTVTGSASAAAAEYKFLQQETNRLGLNTIETAQAYTKLMAAARGTSLEGQAVRDVFISVSEAAAVLRLSAGDVAGVIRALEQIISKGTVSMEELKLQLGDRLPGVLKVASRAIGRSVEDFVELLEAGKLISEDFIPKFSRAMREEFAGGVEEASKSAQADIGRLGNAYDVIVGKVGDAIVSSDAYRNSINSLTAAFETLAISMGMNEEENRQEQLAISKERVVELEKAIKDLIETENTWLGYITPTSGAIKRMNDLLAEEKKKVEELTNKRKPATDATEKDTKAKKDNAAATKKQGETVEDYIRKLKGELEISQYMGKEREVQTALIRAQEIALKQKTKVTAAEAAEIRKTVEATYAYNEATKKAKDATEEMARRMEHALDNLQDKLTDFLVTGKFGLADFSNMLKRTGAEIISSQIIGGGKSLFSSLLSGGGTGPGGDGSFFGGINLSSLSNLSSLKSLFSGGGGLSNMFSGLNTPFFSNPMLSGYTPMTGLAGFGGNMLGNMLFGGDRGVGATIGGTLGGVAGGFFGPLGALGGSFLGNAIGGMFGGGRPHPAATFGGTVGENGMLGNLDIRSKHVDDKFAKDLMSMLQPMLTGLVSAGAQIAGQAITGGVDDGRGFLGFGQSITDPKFKGVTFDPNDEMSMAGAIADFVQQLGDMSDTLDSSVKTALENITTEGKSAEEVLNSVAEALNIVTARSDFNKSVQDSILAIVDPVAFKLKQINETFDAMLEQAKALGADAAEVERLRALSIEQAMGATSEAQTGQVGLMSALQNAMVEAQRAAAAFDALVGKLEESLTDLLLGPNSALNSDEKIALAKGNIGELLASGTVEALSKLPEAVNQFVSLSRAANATGGTFAEDFAFAQAALQQGMTAATTGAATSRAQAASAAAALSRASSVQGASATTVSADASIGDLLGAVNQMVDQQKKANELAAANQSTDFSRRTGL